MRNYIVGALLIVLPLSLFLSCAHRQTSPKTTPKEELQVGNITLRPHQVAPINYLLKHPDQKGLLLAHYLGTGKTFTALGFAELSGESQIYILAPKVLRGNWKNEMQRMGVKKADAYHFVSFEEAYTFFRHRDLSKAILIIDEVHHFVDLMKSQTGAKRNEYVELYEKLRGSKRVLALSGTPISHDISDIAYIFNLVSGEEILPFNERDFLDRYTKINKGRSLWRGHLTESHVVIFGAPFVLAAVPLAFVTPYIGLISGLYFGGIGAGFLALPLLNNSVPLSTYPLRSFDTEKLKDTCKHYVSYYDFRENIEALKSYPKKKFRQEKVAYNNDQIDYFLRFADMALSGEDIATLAKERSYALSGNVFIESTTLQKDIRNIPLSGREIGNFHFAKSTGITESPKFEAIYQTMMKNPHHISVYSHYFENGIILFKEFLQRKNFTGNVQILDADFDAVKQNKIIAEYNEGKIDVLLLDPAFSEGISLLKTNQLHILEPPGSEAMLEQIIGRVIRLNSHKDLPERDRVVNVYVWESELSGLNAFLKKNNNWALRFNELNSIASLGTGQAEIDANYFVKKMSPDTFAAKKSSFISNAMQTLKQLFEEYSIEKKEANRE